MSSSGKGHALPGLRPWSDLLALPDLPSQDRDSYLLAHDLYFGNLPLTPTPIPYTWITPPSTFRPDPPINSARVSQPGVGTAYASDEDSVDEYGEWGSPITLHSDCAADPQNLATWLVASYSDPRNRLPSLTLSLLRRNTAECRRILSRRMGERITITGAPANWPQGATEQVIEGVIHNVGVENRTVMWNTAPVIGSSPGQSGPWVRADQSQITGGDLWVY